MNEGYQQFVDRAHEFACGIYKQFPGALVPKPSDAGYKHIWDDLCWEPPPSNLPGLPPPPVSEFSGGQCQCAVYDVAVRFRMSDYPDYQGETSVRVFGAIGGLSYSTSGRSQFLQISCFGREAEGCLSQSVLRNVYENPNYPTVQFIEGRIERIDRVGGSDNCGDPPKKFPPSPPPPPQGYYSPPIVINNNDGDTYNYIFNLQPPTKEKYPNMPFPPITVKVEGSDADLRFDIDFNFGGDISINRPDQGGGGLPSNFRYEFSNLGSGLNGVANGVDDLDRLLGFGFAPPNFESSPNVAKEKKVVDGEGKMEEDKEGLLGVFVKLTKLPSDIQFGTPNVNFAGWLTFLVQGGYAPRNPIAFEEGYFAAPPGATGYALTFTKGARGEVTLYSRQE